MKYNDNNKPIVCMMTQSTCYKGTTKGTPVGILWHDTAGGNKKISRYVQPSDNDPNKDELLELLGKNKYGNDWNHIDRQAGVNAFVGELASGEVSSVQTLPWNYRPWGCGSGSKGSCNGSSSVTNSPFWIQFEMCDDGYKDSNYFNKVYKEACELTAYLCKLYNINPCGTIIYNGVTVPTILCHWDSYELGLGSGHSDVYGWFNKFGKTMEDVRKDVKKLIDDSAPKIIYRVRKTWEDKQSQIGAYTILDYAIANCPVGYGVYDPNGVEMYRHEEDVQPEPEPDVPDVDPEQEKFNQMMNVWLANRAKLEPSKWSKSARKWAESNGLITGYDNGVMGYKNFITREELITILYKFYSFIKENS